MSEPLIELNAEQELAIKQWANDDRLWSTQETVEFNLSTFARVILKDTTRQISDSQKQVALSIEELATTYFVKQMADMKEYIESIRKSFQMDEQKFDALALQLMNWSSIYVHGANLASTKLMLDQSQKQVAMLRDALSPLAAWWAFIQAQHELEESKPFDEHVIALSFMGSGASTNVTVGQLNAIIKALSSTTPPPYVHESVVEKLKGDCEAWNRAYHEEKLKVKQSRIKAMEECLEVAHKLGPDEWSCAVVEAICSLIAQEKGGDVK